MTTSRFDQAAASWDEQPARVALAKKIAGAILDQVPVQPSMTALDFGCGTGLVTLALQPAFRRIIGVDSSAGMLAKLREKIAAMGVQNVEARQLDLTTDAPPADLRVDVIVSAMALHHIADIPQLLSAFRTLLNPGGYLALADLDTEDGSFHSDSAEVYHTGIDRTGLQEQLAALGFTDLQATTAHVVERPDSSGTLRRYPIFLVSGRLEA
jgi:cyclopropane fatty-acyl-phospholipid synthase-like methyltransferase